MGRVKIPYYVVVKGRGYWRPHPRMRTLGFQIVRCGADGPEAWAIAVRVECTLAGRAQTRSLPAGKSRSAFAR